MDSILDMPIPADVGAEVVRLATHCNGPEPLRMRLAAWGTDYARAVPSALDGGRIGAALRDLVTLAHSNCLFSLADAPGAGVGPARAGLEFQDSGGYGACMIAVVNLLDSLPLPEAEIALLQDMARYWRAQQEQDMLERLRSVHSALGWSV